MSQRHKYNNNNNIILIKLLRRCVINIAYKFNEIVSEIKINKIFEELLF